MNTESVAKPAVTITAIENWAAEHAPKLGTSLDKATLRLIKAHRKHGVTIICHRGNPLHQERRPQE
jgi:hypothetical protein